MSVTTLPAALQWPTHNGRFGPYEHDGWIFVVANSADGAQVARSDDQGETWSSHSLGGPNEQAYDSDVIDNVICVLVLKTGNGGIAVRRYSMVARVTQQGYDPFPVISPPADRDGVNRLTMAARPATNEVVILHQRDPVAVMGTSYDAIAATIIQLNTDYENATTIDKPHNESYDHSLNGYTLNESVIRVVHHSGRDIFFLTAQLDLLNAGLPVLYWDYLTGTTWTLVRNSTARGSLPYVAMRAGSGVACVADTNWDKPAEPEVHALYVSRETTSSPTEGIVRSRRAEIDPDLSPQGPEFGATVVKDGPDITEMMKWGNQLGSLSAMVRFGDSYLGFFVVDKEALHDEIRILIKSRNADADYLSTLRVAAQRSTSFSPSGAVEVLAPGSLWLGDVIAWVSYSNAPSSTSTFGLARVEFESGGQVFYWDAKDGITQSGWTNPANAFDGDIATWASQTSANAGQAMYGDAATVPANYPQSRVAKVRAFCRWASDAGQWTSQSVVRPWWTEYGVLEDGFDGVNASLKNGLSVGVVDNGNAVGVVWGDPSDNNVKFTKLAFQRSELLEVGAGVAQAIGFEPAMIGQIAMVQDFRVVRSTFENIELAWSHNELIQGYTIERQIWNGIGDPP